MSKTFEYKYLSIRYSHSLSTNLTLSCLWDRKRGLFSCNFTKNYIESLIVFNRFIGIESCCFYCRLSSCGHWLHVKNCNVDCNTTLPEGLSEEKMLLQEFPWQINLQIKLGSVWTNVCAVQSWRTMYRMVRENAESREFRRIFWYNVLISCLPWICVKFESIFSVLFV